MRALEDGQPSGIGVYVHFPYCRSKCSYCDFAVHVVRVIPHVEYATAILSELALRAPEFEALGPLRTIFLGGGTPSLWEPAQIERVLRGIRGRFARAEPLEISIEINPGDLEGETYRIFRELGVTRASLGIQSFDAEVLRGLGRRHSGDEATRALDQALEAGFEVVSADLIHGGPGQTREIAALDAARVAKSGAHHVSDYGLTLDELAVDVPLARAVRLGKISVADADGQAELGAASRGVLEAAGLSRYEISNFARRGAQCRHNLGYWRCSPYLGLGVGAFGATSQLRYGNTREIVPYLTALGRGQLPPGERDPLDVEARFQERVFLGLRLVDGLSLAALAADFGAPRADAFRVAISAPTFEGLVRMDADRVALTERGLDLHSEIAAHLI